MRTTTCHVAIATTLLSLALVAPVGGQVALPPDDAAPRRPAAAERFNLGLRGVYFVENRGQWSDATVHYGLKSRGLDVAFRESSFTMHLARPIEDATNASRGRGFAPPRIASIDDHDLSFDETRGVEDSAPAYEHLTLTVTFPDSNPVTPRGAQEQTAKFNYFVGGEGRETASNVPSFGAVVYENLYDGIDLLVTGNDDGVMKYEFHCTPGADYAQIRIHYDGIDSLCVNEDGDLEIATTFGTLRDGAPLVWQGSSANRGKGSAPRRIADASQDESTSRARQEAALDVARAAPLADTRGSSNPTIPARFELIDGTTYGVTLDDPVDPTRPLIIDPDIEWMDYRGGSGAETGRHVERDAGGNFIVCGTTSSPDFEGRNNLPYGGYDVFVMKLNPSGALVRMTYLGGSGDDHMSIFATPCMTLDTDGNALLTGRTGSTDFAGRLNSHHGGATDVFALKLNTSGALEWMYYLGGAARDEGHGIALDSLGNIVVTGWTGSSAFEGRLNTHYGGFDAFVAKVDPALGVQWMLYLGGTGEQQVHDHGDAIAIDENDDILVIGSTASLDFEGRRNTFDPLFDYCPFILKVSASGQLEWMYYVQVNSFCILDMHLTGDGNIIVTGQEWLAGCCGYVMKLDPVGNVLWQTHWTGSEFQNEILGLDVDDSGHICVTGLTDSTDLEGHLNSYHGGLSDAFVGLMSPSGQILWSYYLGGAASDFGYGIVLNDAGSALIVGSTQSTDFEGSRNAFRGDRDAFVVQFRLVDGPQLSVGGTCPSGGPIQIEWSDATPEGQVALIFARNTGSFTIPNNRPCPGTQLGLGSNQIQLAWQGGAGQNGSRTLNASAGPAACGGYLQLLDLTTCGTSNVARIE